MSDLTHLLRWDSRDGREPGERILMVWMRHPSGRTLDYSYRVTAKRIDFERHPSAWLWAIVLFMQDTIIEFAEASDQ